jgi:hypothetical protein
MGRSRWPFKGRSMNLEGPSTVDPIYVVPRRLGRKKSGRWPSIAESAICAASLCVPLALIGVIDFHRYQPSRDATTIDRLVAELPETLKFVVVEHGDRPYVVWIGRPRGAIVSGPPVCVFDATGALVDRTFDAGDSASPFVHELHATAYSAPGITAQKALDFCHPHRATSK